MNDAVWPVIERSSIFLTLLVSYSVLAERLKTSIRRHGQLSTAIVYGLLILACLAGIGGFVGSYRVWRRNQALQTQATQAVDAANHRAKQTNNKASTLTPGKAPSTAQPSTAAYHVAPNLPQLLVIPKLNITARVLPVGLDADGSIATPSNVFDTAWYTGSALPGKSGATLIDGHISSWTSPGVFYHLDELRPGDTIQIKRGDGQTIRYIVQKTTVYDEQKIDMSTVLRPVVASRPGLNLISCYGHVMQGTSDFSKRIVVFAAEE